MTKLTAMTTRRADANRANARRSTGPRTAAGKRASSRNALAHGLNTPVADSEVIANLALSFAPAGTDDPDIMMAAHRAAIAHVQYARVQTHFDALYGSLDTPLCMVAAEVAIPENYARLGSGVAALLMDIIPPPPTVQKTTIPEFAKALERLARYERRAFSARNKALDQLEQAIRAGRLRQA